MPGSTPRGYPYPTPNEPADGSPQIEALARSIDTDVAGAVRKAGDTMTGLLVLSANPAAALGAATKQYVDDSASTAWTAPTLANGWVNAGGSESVAGYRKLRGGLVQLRGTIMSGTAAGATVFTLPAGFRPLTQHTIATVANNNAPAAISINSAGNVKLWLGSGATNAWFSLSCSFYAEA